MAKESTVVIDTNERISPFVPMSAREVIGVGLAGAGVGLVVAGLQMIFSNYVFGAALCRDQGLSCSNAPFYAMIVAMILGGLVGLALLARQRVYRPLLVVLSVTIALWMFHVVIAGLDWWLAIIAAMILFAIAYMLFAWIARVRNFVIAIIATVLVIIAVRLILA